MRNQLPDDRLVSYCFHRVTLTGITAGTGSKTVPAKKAVALLTPLSEFPFTLPLSARRFA